MLQKILSWAWENKAASIITVFAVSFSLVSVYRQHTQDNEIAALKEMIREQNGVKHVPKVYEAADGVPIGTAQISAAGQISTNMARDFDREINRLEQRIAAGKASNTYVYTTRVDADSTVRDFNEKVSKGQAPKEVQESDFVTVEKQEAETTVQKNPETGKDEVVHNTTVKINAYKNYKPSIYYMPQAYPDAGKRHDVIYANRDFILDVNYDTRRNGNKVGVSVGYRIKSW